LNQKKPDEDSVFHVHYGDGKDIDPVHGEETPIQTGYAQKLAKTGDDLVFHVHTENDQDIDPIHGVIVNPNNVYGAYGQKSAPEPRRIVAI